MGRCLVAAESYDSQCPLKQGCPSPTCAAVNSVRLTLTWIERVSRGVIIFAIHITPPDKCPRRVATRDYRIHCVKVGNSKDGSSVGVGVA